MVDLLLFQVWAGVEDTGGRRPGRKNMMMLIWGRFQKNLKTVLRPLFCKIWSGGQTVNSDGVGHSVSHEVGAIF